MVSISNLKGRVEEKCVTLAVLLFIQNGVKGIYKCNIKVYKFDNKTQFTFI